MSLLRCLWDAITQQNDFVQALYVVCCVLALVGCSQCIHFGCYLFQKTQPNSLDKSQTSAGFRCLSLSTTIMISACAMLTCLLAVSVDKLSSVDGPSVTTCADKETSAYALRTVLLVVWCLFLILSYELFFIFYYTRLVVIVDGPALNISTGTKVSFLIGLILFPTFMLLSVVLQRADMSPVVDAFGAGLSFVSLGVYLIQLVILCFLLMRQLQALFGMVRSANAKNKLRTREKYLGVSSARTPNTPGFASPRKFRRPQLVPSTSARSRNLTQTSNILRRLVILAAVSIAFKLVVIVVFTCACIVMLTTVEGVIDWMTLVCALVLMLDCNIGVFCIMLQFESYTKVYDCMCSECEDLKPCQDYEEAVVMQENFDLRLEGEVPEVTVAAPKLKLNIEQVSDL